MMEESHILTPCNYGELLSVSSEEFGIFDSDIEAEDFSKKQSFYKFNDDNYRVYPDFEDFGVIESNQFLPPVNHRLNEYIVPDEGGIFSVRKSIGSVYFEDVNCRTHISEDRNTVTIRPSSEGIDSILVIKSDMSLTFLGSHNYYIKNLWKLYDFLCLLKLNVYNI